VSGHCTAGLRYLRWYDSCTKCIPAFCMHDCCTWLKSQLSLGKICKWKFHVFKLSLFVIQCLQEYLKLRTAHITGLKNAGDNPYPHKFHVSISLTDFVEKYSSIPDGEQHSDVVSVAGNAKQLFGKSYCLTEARMGLK
jgi:hypothetical protein